MLMSRPHLITIVLLTTCAALLVIPPAHAVDASQAGTGNSAPVIPAREQVLATLREGHPRVLATREDFQRLRKIVAENAEAAQWFAALRKEGEEPLPLPSREGKTGLNYNLKGSATLRHRAFLLGLLFQLSGDKSLAGRLWPDLEYAIHAEDWRPSHFLTTAEVTSALGIAYDWLYEAWTPDQRGQIRKALIEKGLNPAIAVYHYAANGGPSDAANDGWPKVNHNWNQVCNGGLLVGALAIADEQPETAREVIHSALNSLPLALAEYAPDGAWAEGPDYWAFATEYTVEGLAALNTALGTDFGLSSMPGLSNTGDFLLHTSGPTGLRFNFSDSGMGALRAYSPLFWLATRYDAPRFAARQIPNAAKKPQPLDLLWGAQWIGRHPENRIEPLCRYFSRHSLVTLRSAWNDPRALYVGCKGGDNKANHSHLDLGSFVFDALGKRWAYDLGSDSYLLPQYFHQRRWTYYRLRAEGHNTLVLNPGAWPDQNPRATAAIARFSEAAPSPFAIINLSDAYSGDARLARRGFRLLGGRQLLIQDELTCDTPADLWWFMHTVAEVACEGPVARLTIQGERLTARILEPAGARFETLPAKPLPSNQNPEGQMLKPMHSGADDQMKKLAIHLPGFEGERRVVVLLTPEAGKVAPEPEPVVPLDQWR